MDAENDNPPLESRPATPTDLVELCLRLNEEQVRYIVIGGMAMIQQGLMRLTTDIDLLVATDAENIQRLKRAMAHLPDGAINDVRDEDVETYGVVRVADEFVVDLMSSACGINFEEASSDVEHITVDGVSIPVAGRKTLWLTKRTYREKDALDRNYLKRVMREHGEFIPETKPE